MFGITVVPTMMANRRSDETKHMVVVAGDRDTAEMIRSRIEQRQEEEEPGGKGGLKLNQKRGLPQANFTVEDKHEYSGLRTRSPYAKVKDKKLDAFLWATPDAIEARKLDFVTNDVSSFIDNGVLGTAVNDALRRSALKSKGLKDDEIEASLQSVEVPRKPVGKKCPQSASNVYCHVGDGHGDVYDRSVIRR